MLIIIVVLPGTDSWRSHDGFNERSDGILEPAGGSNYSSQRRVFEDLGQGVLDNAFEGKSFLKFLSFFEVEETEGFDCVFYILLEYLLIVLGEMAYFTMLSDWRIYCLFLHVQR